MYRPITTLPRRWHAPWLMIVLLLAGALAVASGSRLLAAPPAPAPAIAPAAAPANTATPEAGTPTDTPTPLPAATDTATPLPVDTDTPTPAESATPTGTPTPCTIHFSDVAPDDYFYVPVQFLYCRGVISGYADGTFRPYNSTTRSQQVKMVVLGFQFPLVTPTPGTYTFADVPPAFPFYYYIETAVRAGLLSGYQCGGPGEPCDPQNRPYYRPYALTTREQFAKIVVNAAGWGLINPPNPTFADVPVDNPFYPAIETAYCHGIISGYTCGGPGEPCDPQSRPYFRPHVALTRGQFTKMMYTALHGGQPCVQPTVTPIPTPAQ